MTKRSVTFTCANANQVANAVPVAMRLLKMDVQCRFVLFDPAYHQDALSALRRSDLAQSVEWVLAPSRPLTRPFARMSFVQRWRAVRAAAREVGELWGDDGGLVLGMDGAFERLILRRYREQGRFTAILWDGLIAGRPELGRTLTNPHALIWNLRRWAHFTGRSISMRTAALVGLDPFVPGLAGHADVDEMYTMGTFVANAFRSQGVRTPIRTTGIPRFSGLSTAGSTPDFSRREVVYLTGSFLWHDEVALHASQQRDLDDLALWLPAAGWRLRVRLHPREDAAHYARLRDREGVVLSEASGGPLWSELARADVVLTAMSTAALEALALGRPIAVFMRNFPRALADTTIGLHPRVPVATSQTELLSALESVAGEQDPRALRSVLDDFISPTTAESAMLIADSVATRLPPAE